MAQRRVVRFTANFESNLHSVQEFLADADAAPAFDKLLDHLFGSVVPNLEQFPGMGVDFLERRCRSIESRASVMRIREDFVDCELREYLFDEYLLLYSVSQNTVDLLAIRHHRQLSFDLESSWF